MDNIYELNKINKDAVTLQDCEVLYERHGIAVNINDGHIKGFEEE